MRADGTGSPIVLDGHRGGINTLQFSADGGRIVSASEDGTARIWSAVGAGEPIVLPHTRWARFTPDGAHVAAAPGNTREGDVVLRIWRADGRDEPAVLRHEGTFWPDGWDVSPDGSRVVAGGHDGVGLWHADGMPSFSGAERSGGSSGSAPMAPGFSRRAIPAEFGAPT